MYLSSQVCIAIGYMVPPLTILAESSVAATNIFSVIDNVSKATLIH